MVRGFKNIVFGGEGLFLATLRGPGKVGLQSMPIMNLAEEIARYLPLPTPQTSSVGSAVAGAVIGGIFGSSSNNSGSDSEA